MTEFGKRRLRMRSDQTTEGVVFCRRNPGRIVPSTRLGRITTGVAKAMKHTPDKTKTHVEPCGEIANRTFAIEVSLKDFLSQIQGVGLHRDLPINTQEFRIKLPLKANIKM